MSDISNQYGSDYSHRPHRNILADAQQTRPRKLSQMSTIDQNQRKIPPQEKSIRISNLSDRRRERETSRLSDLSKTDSIPKPNQHIKSKSPTSSSSILSHRQIHHHQPQSDSNTKNSPFEPELSICSSSHEDLIEENVNPPSRTYRLITNEQPLDGRHVIPSTKYVSYSI